MSGYAEGVAKRLRERASEIGMSQAELARRTKSTKATVNAWFMGHSVPKGIKASAVKEALRCSYDWLFDGTGLASPPPEDAALLGLSQSWLVKDGQKCTRLIKVPMLLADGSFDLAKYEIFLTSMLARFSSKNAAAWFTAAGLSAAPSVNDGDVVLVDTGVKTFSHSGGLYAIAGQGGIQILRAYAELDGSVTLYDNDRDSSVTIEKGNPIAVLGLVRYRAGEVR